jgi:hypothetical protein
MTYWQAVGALLGEGTHILTPDVRRRLLDLIDDGTADIANDPRAYMVACRRVRNGAFRTEQWETVTTYEYPYE